MYRVDEKDMKTDIYNNQIWFGRFKEISNSNNLKISGLGKIRIHISKVIPFNPKYMNELIKRGLKKFEK